MRNKILSLLVLLLTASTGAWADEVLIGDPTVSTSVDGNVSRYLPAYTLYDYSLTQQIYTADEIGTGGTIEAFAMWLKNPSSYTRNVNIYMKEVTESSFADATSWVSLAVGDLVATATIPNGSTEYVETTFTLTTPFEYSGTGNLLICFQDVTGSWSSGVASIVLAANGNQSIEAHRDGTAYDVTTPGVNGALWNVKSVVKLDITVTSIDVTTNAAQEGATFTEATFAMPAFDATVTYELVRDMGYGVTAIANNGVESILVKKGGDEKYQPAVTLTYELKDVIDPNNPVTLVQGTDYTFTGMHILQGSTWQDVTDYTDLVPGIYEVIFTGQGKYDGKVYSQELEFFDMTDLNLAIADAQAYYDNIKDDYADIAATLKQAITDAQAVVDNNESAVEEMSAAIVDIRQAILDAQSDVNLTDAKDLLAQAIKEATAYYKEIKDNHPTEAKNLKSKIKEAQGVLEEGTYVDIVYMTNVLCTALDEARRLVATGIDGVMSEDKNGTWYDINGRRLNDKPMKKGTYIVNGRKVLVK